MRLGLAANTEVTRGASRVTVVAPVWHVRRTLGRGLGSLGRSTGSCYLKEPDGTERISVAGRPEEPYISYRNGNALRLPQKGRLCLSWWSL